MKKCPYCAEQIQDEAIKCRYCGSMLTGAEPASNQTRWPTASAPNADDQEAIRLTAAGQKIQAIKFIREKTGMGLAEAKAYVEALERGQRPTRAGQSAQTAGATRNNRSGCLTMVLLLILAGGGMFATFNMFAR
jgi:ribosomal protein L7/L12